MEKRDTDKSTKSKKRQRLDHVDNDGDQDNMGVVTEDKPEEPIDSLERDQQVSFKSAQDIANALDTSNLDLLVQGFTHLREHLKICNRKPAADKETAQARILRETCRRIVYEWAEQSNEFSSISTAWNNTSSNSSNRLDALIPGSISGLLEVLDSTATHKYGSRLIRMILDGGLLRNVYRAFGTARSSACASTLQLLYQMVVFARGEHADQLRHVFDWSLKTLDTLVHTRAIIVGFSIRRLWIRFVLAFFEVERCKTFGQILGTRKIISNMFQNVEKDTYQELHALLSSVYQNIVLNEDISRAEKTRVFGVQLFGNLAKACQITQPLVPEKVGITDPARFIPPTVSDQMEEPQIISSDSMCDLVIRFLRGMMTFQGYGICFKQYGLYPATRKWTGSSDNDSEDMHDVATFTKSWSSAEMQDLCNSQILRILVICLNPASSKQMAEVVVDIMRASPELIAPFWRNYHCSFEPRLSLRYLTNTGLAIKIMSLPLPVTHEMDMRHNGPPRLNTLVEHIIPFALDPVLVGRGLSANASALVRYRNLLMVDVALCKLTDARAMIQAETKQATGADAHKWLQLEQRLLAVVKQRLPQCHHIISVHHHLMAIMNDKKGDNAVDGGEEAHRESSYQHAVIGNALMRVLSGYQIHFSGAVAEARFDFGSLVEGIRLSNAVAALRSSQDSAGVHGAMNAHTLLYLLRALEKTPAGQTKWMNRVKLTTTDKGTDSEQDVVQHTYLGVVLILALFAERQELRAVAKRVAVNALQSTGLFDHDTNGSEVQCWVDAVMRLISPHSERNIMLSQLDKGTVQSGRRLVGMLEDAIMMSSKLPFKYVDRIHAATAASEESILAFSPLLAGVIEAALVKMAFGSKSLGSRLREVISNGASNYNDISKAIAAELKVDIMFGMVKEVVCNIAHICGDGSITTVQHLRKFMLEAAKLTLEPRIAKLEGSSNKKEKEKAPAERQFCSMVEQGYSKSIQPLIGYLQSLGESTAVVSEKKQKPAKSLASSTAKSLKKEMSNMCSNVGANLERFINTLVTAVREDEATVSSITTWLLKRTQKLDQGTARQAGFIAAITWITRYYRVCSSKDSLWTIPEFLAVAEEIQQIDDLSFLLVLFRHLVASNKVSTLIGSTNGSRRLLTHLLLASRGSSQFIPYIALLICRLQSEPQPIASTPSDSEAIAFVFAMARTSVKSLSDGASKERALETFVQAIVTSQYQLLNNPTLDFEAAVLMRQSVDLVGDVKMARRIWTSLAIKASDMLALATTNGNNLLPIVRIMSPAINEILRSQLVDSLLALTSKGIDHMVAGTILMLVENLDYQASKHTSTAIEKLRSQLVSKWLADLPNESADNILDDAVMRATRISSDNDSTGLLAKINSAKAVLRQANSGYIEKGNDAKEVDAGLDYLWERASSSSSQYEADSMKRQILRAILRSEPVIRNIASEWVKRMLAKEPLKGEQLSLLAWMAYSVEAGSDVNNRKLCIHVGQRMFDRGGVSSTAKWIEKIVEGDVGVKNITTSFILCSNAVSDEVVSLCRAITENDRYPLYLAAEMLNSLANRCYNQYLSGTDVRMLAVGAITLVVEFINKHFGRLSNSSSNNDQQTSTAMVVSVDTLCQALNLLTKTAMGFQDTDSITQVQKTCLEFVDSVISDSRLLRVEMDPTCKMPAYRLVALICLFAFKVNGDHSNVELKTAKQWFMALRRLLACQEFSKWAQAGSLRDPLILTVHSMWTFSRGAMSKWSVDVDDYLALDELEALAGAYTGSIAPSDKLLLEMMREYEQLSGQSVQRALLVFGPDAAVMYDRDRASRERYGFDRDENVVGVVDDDTIARALNLIDSARMRHTAANFPIHGIAASDPVATLEDSVCRGHRSNPNDSVKVYDSQFAMAWVWTLISVRDAVVDMRQVIECGAVSVALSGLSSACERTRKLAYFTMDVIYKRISEATILSGRKQCLLALDSLRNAITGRTDAEFPLLPFPTVQFIGSALSAMLRPTHPLFSDANRQLLRRMCVRLTDLPLLRAALRPSTRMERSVVLRMTADAARAYDRSISAYSRTDCLNAMLALASSPLGDVTASMSALTLLFHLTSANNPQALVLHVAGRGMPMLPWVQLQITREANGLAAAVADMRSDGGNKGELYRMRAAIGNITALVRIIVRAVANYPLVHRGNNGSSPLIERFWVARSNNEQKHLPQAPGQSMVAGTVVLVLKSLAEALKCVNTGGLQLETVSAVLVLVSTCIETFHLLATLQKLQSGKNGQTIGMARCVAQDSLSILTCLEITVIDQEWKKERSSSAASQLQLSAIAQAELPESLFYSQTGSVCASYRQCIESLAKWCLHPAAGSTCTLADSVDIISRSMAIDAPIASSIETWVNEFQDLSSVTSPVNTPLDVKFRQSLELSK